MIEKIITSKTRVKILKLFLIHIDDRYYLRELERKLDESLSPLRRQLIKLEKMGILITEAEANLKYYRLNKNFTGIGELQKLVLGTTEVFKAKPLTSDVQGLALNTRKRVKYDIAVLTVISFFVLATAAFIVYSNTRNMKQVAGLVSGKPAIATSQKKAVATRDDEMISRRWKVRAGSFPVLSSGETDGDNSQEL
ncbi:MAG: winged helix-turn-helix domain-containing protein [Candidatus Omnitrophica bacterium]|nr:winged helix-turn-helix domain-containing protein [Candidatus Omnitrophota bacterium]MBU4589309.1 winged helix-turn-helix domain-containing protein [Candidatus Omnitrophota bacterium]